MSDQNYRMSKTTKALLSMTPYADRKVFKDLMIDAEVTAEAKESFTMNYDVNQNGGRARK